MTKLTNSELAACRRLARYIYEDSLIPDIAYHLRDMAPEAWSTLERDVETTEPKVKITLWLDASVAKMFRAMGRGYQARINRVLATWCQMRIAKVINDKDAFEQIMARRPENLKAERLERIRGPKKSPTEPIDHPDFRSIKAKMRRSSTGP